jgi:aspartyl-tRNA(Asn)/glutamyl-tRNA(Gln) amidotransferase subunit C
MTNEEIRKLAHMVRIDLTDGECKNISESLDSVLGYIDQIKSVDLGEIKNEDLLTNQNLRDDVETNLPIWTDEFFKNVPVSEGNHVRVPRVLNQD